MYYSVIYLLGNRPVKEPVGGPRLDVQVDHITLCRTKGGVMRVALTLAFLFAGLYLLVNYNRYRSRAAEGGIPAPNGAQTDASAADKQKLHGVWRAVPRR